MPDLLQELADAAEGRVPLPDLADLESRGRDLRRTRRALAGAAVVVLVVASGLGARLVGGDRAADPAPVDEPDRHVERLDNVVADGNESTLRPGAEHVVQLRAPWGDQGLPVQARFTVPGSDWRWWGSGATKNLTDAEEGIGWDPGVTVTVTRSDRVATTQCATEIPVWEDLDAQPLVAARQIADVPGVDVLRGPRAVAELGRLAAYVRLSVPKVCEEWGDILLWGLTPDNYGGDPGVGTVLRAGNLLDVWVVAVDGALVVVRAEHTPGLPDSFLEETRALVESIRLEPAAE